MTHMAPSQRSHRSRPSGGWGRGIFATVRWESLGFEEAQALTQKIRVAADDLWGLVVVAYQARAWTAMGYRTWDVYVSKELGDLRFRLPREDRREIVQSLRDNGLSLRAIAAVTGYDKHTVSRDLAARGGANAPRTHCRRRTCKDLPESFWKVATDLAKIGDRLTKLSGNSGFEAHTERIKEASLRDLRKTRDALDQVIAKLEGALL